jgi:hypothetical protein
MGGSQMDHQEFRKRLEEARALAAMQRLEAVEMLAMNVDLRHENGDALTRECTRQLGNAHQVRIKPNLVEPTEPSASSDD